MKLYPNSELRITNYEFNCRPQVPQLSTLHSALSTQHCFAGEQSSSPTTDHCLLLTYSVKSSIIATLLKRSLENGEKKNY